MSLTICHKCLVWIPVVVVGTLLIRVAYVLLVHPLRRFPGPILARTFDIVWQYHALRGEQHIWVAALHAKYGPVVRIAPNQISSIEPDAWKEIYGHKATHFQKAYSFYGPDFFGSPPGLIRADNAAHARQRKLVSHAFSDKALREQEQLLKNYAVLLASQLANKAKSEATVDMVSWYNFTTFDIMADLTFGEPLKLLEGNEYVPWVKSIFDNIKLVQIASLISQWPGLRLLFNRLIPTELKLQRERHMQYSVDRVQKRIERRTDRPDIWTYVMRYSESEENNDKGLRPTEMRSNASTFMVAGSETTATELSGLTYYLLRNPKKLERLVKEVRETFATYEDINMAELARLPYLSACIEEGLRIYPPVSLGLPRQAPKGGAEVGGLWIPGGTIIFLSHYAAYHSSTNFKDPDSFVPERWLPEGVSEYCSDRKEVLQPFSYGPRNCLGKNLAYHEMRLVLATILWHFDLNLSAQSDDWTEQEVYILWKKHPLMCTIKNIRE